MLHHAAVKKSKHDAMRMLHWIRLFTRLFLSSKAGKMQITTRKKGVFVCLQRTASCHTTWLAFLPQAAGFGLNSVFSLITVTLASGNFTFTGISWYGTKQKVADHLNKKPCRSCQRFQGTREVNSSYHKQQVLLFRRQSHRLIRKNKDYLKVV